jgi:hypothetical protein
MAKQESELQKQEAEVTIQDDSDSALQEDEKMPTAAPAKKITVGSESKWAKAKNWYLAKKYISIPLTIIIIFAVLAALPWTRAYTAGLFIKKQVNVFVIDTKTGSVVSSADVEISGHKALTNGQGVATLNSVPVGQHTVLVTKNYYKDSSSKISVGFSNPQTFQVKTVATGRQTKVHVVNLVNHKDLAEVKLSAGDITAKTDKSGNATIVLPAGTTSKETMLSLEGYNDAKVIVKVSDAEVVINNFSLTPSGKVYFLSKLSGKIDLVKTNLDGTGRETVFAGTGKEDDIGTVLLASRDWKYLALLARHDSDLPKLYLIETANDKVTTMDEGNASFSLVGWDDDTFIYQVTRNTFSEWQSKKNVLKSFNADTKQLLALDQTDASGNSGQYIQEQLGNVYNLEDGTILYSKTWYSFPYDNPGALDGKQNGIYSIRADGSGKKTLKSLSAKDTSYINSTPSKPNEVYFYYYDNGSTTPTYLEYSDGAIKTIDSKDFPENGVYNTYLLSPGGKQTFWSEQRDGKNTLLLGGSNGQDGKSIAKLTDYQTYGWYTDDYLLVSKNSSELYIMSTSGLNDELKAIKISDYHKPAQNYYGYGGGYGGI